MFFFKWCSRENKNGEREKTDRKGRRSLIEPGKKLRKCPLSVFPTQVITEKSSPLEKELVLNRLKVHLSVTKKHSCCYGRKAGDGIQERQKGKRGKTKERGGGRVS